MINKTAFILLTIIGLIISSCSTTTEEIILKSEAFELALNSAGSIVSFVDLRTGVNHISTDTLNPLLSIRIKGEVFAPVQAQQKGDILQFKFPNNIDASVKVIENPRYITFEVASITNSDSIEMVLWGPYCTTIGGIIGETVGVVRDEEFAIGIQSLNLKTLGGYPWNESDRMPAFDIFRQEDVNNMHPDKDGSVLYRVEAAKPTLSGSSLQAYTRNRSTERIIQDFNHERILAPPHEDGGVVGSKIALFGCQTDNVLDVIETIELTEGLPHPKIDGEWSKRSPIAPSAYLITSFTEADVEQAIELTKRAGLKHLYHYGKTFENWGHFELYKGEFPNGIEGLRICVEKAESEGIKIGTHFLSNFITTNDPYVTPVPDPRLAIVGKSVITSNITADESTIPIESPEYFNQMKNNNLKTVKIGDELIRYGQVSEDEPWRLIDCQRGAFGTRASEHNAGDEIVKLLDHAYKVFLTNADLTIEMSERIANIYNQAGLRQISFDGLEGNRSTGLGTYGESLMPYIWYQSLSDNLKDHLIIDASRTTHFFWHIYTRMNWGEPWYGGFRESQTEYRFNNQAYFKRNYMPGMLGWFKMTPETSVEDIEWLLARSAGYDAGYALVADQKVVEQNGNSDEILKLIGDWEKLRLSSSFSESQKELMRDQTLEFSLSEASQNKWLLKQINSEIFRHEEKEKQPGEPTHSTFEFTNLGEEQSMLLNISAINCEVKDIAIEIDNYKTVEIPITLKKGDVVKYEGGNKLKHYNSTWDLIKEYETNQEDFLVNTNSHSLTFNSSITPLGESPHVKVEVRTVTSEEIIDLAN